MQAGEAGEAGEAGVERVYSSSSLSKLNNLFSGSTLNQNSIIYLGLSENKGAVVLHTTYTYNLTLQKVQIITTEKGSITSTNSLRQN
ncbi:hypothetical protein NIES4103_26230 [Nostoc sp. NIES-4103]|nr:hypothetical protein NIES4103_26230 [Nostoc sp. NIES-4103]